LFQLVLEREDLALNQTADFMADVGLPICFKDMGLSPTNANFKRVMQRIAMPGSGIEAEPFRVKESDILSDLISADDFGSYVRKKRDESGFPKPYCWRDIHRKG
jgi:glycerol dehydrogenase-like iron-containing ADH family enzyme